MMKKYFEIKSAYMVATQAKENVKADIIGFAENVKEIFSNGSKETERKNQLSELQARIAKLDQVATSLEELPEAKKEVIAKRDELQAEYDNLSAVPVDDYIELGCQFNSLIHRFIDAMQAEIKASENLAACKITDEEVSQRVSELDRQLKSLEEAKAVAQDDFLDAIIASLKDEKAEIEKFEPKQSEEEQQPVIAPEVEEATSDAEETAEEPKLIAEAKAYKKFVENSLDTFPTRFYSSSWREFFAREYFDKLSSAEKLDLYSFLTSELAITCKVNSYLFFAVADQLGDKDARKELLEAEIWKTAQVGKYPVSYKKLAEYDANVADYLRKRIGGSLTDDMDFGPYIYTGQDDED